MCKRLMKWCAQVVRGLGRHLELQEAAKRQKQMQREREQVHTTSHHHST
eukprot:COSAG04_NODE_7537_length_1112_cov_0.858835_3_plen_48_part_01